MSAPMHAGIYGGVCPNACWMLGYTGAEVSAPMHAGIHRGRGVSPNECWDTYPPVNRITDRQV